MLKKAWKWLLKNEGLVLILLLVILLRIPSLYEPYWYGDEGIYLVLGQGLRKGLVFYRDIHDNKPPLLYLLAAIAGNVFYFRLILMAWFGAGTVLFFRLMQKLWPKSKKAWYWSTLAMIYLTTMTEGNVANAEIFIVPLVIWGMWWLLEAAKKKEKRWQRWLGIGVIFSMGALLKVPAGFDFLAAIIWWLFFERKKLKEILKGLVDKRVWLMGLGFGGVIGITLIYYAIVGGFEPYLRSALLQNIGYLSTWKGGEHAAGLAGQSGLTIRGLWLMAGLVGYWLMARKYRLKSELNLVVVWFLMAWFGALLSERPYPHYLIQPAVPAAILLSYLVFEKKKAVKQLVVILGIISLGIYLKINFWHYGVTPYYRNFVEYALGKKSLEDYRGYFDPRVNQTYRLAEYLKTSTTENDRVFIWGTEPNVYALANRLPIGRYTATYHIVDFNGYEETIEAWDKYEPKVVIVMKYEEKEFPEMESRLGTDYVLAERVDEALVYRRVNGIKTK